MPSDDHTSYGDSFNAVKGGVYAMKWDSDHISVWHFSRGKVPSDISDKNPDPSSWGLPDAIFGGDSCNVDKYFKNMSLVININFCGDYGSAAWGTEDSCNNFADSCPKYVAENPEAFANAYWDVNYIDAYQWSDKATPTKKHSSTSSTSTASSTSTPASSASSSAAAVPTSSPAITTPAPGATTPAPAGFDTTVTQGVTVTTTTSCPTPTATNPVTANKFSHLGCFSSSSSFGCFNSTASNDAMTVELCTSQCAGHTFAAVSGSKCFCADSLDAGTRAATFDASEPSAQCDQPCPGNGDELCGSQSSHLMNVYGAVQDEVRSMDPPPMATTVPKWYNSPDGDAEDLPSTTAAAATTLATAAAGKNGTAIITSPPTTNTYVPIARAAEHAAPSLLVVFSTVLVLGFLAL